VVGKRLAPSLASLDGKTICLVDGNFDKASGIFMEQLEGWFADHLPSVKTRIVRWREPFQDDPEASEVIRAHGDAAILGVGI
jgi:hypothetical protein